MPSDHTADTSARRALFTGIIDYAGLFPPARLPLDQAFPRFRLHRGRTEAWMLARFVLPAARINDFTAFAHEVPALPHPIALLGSGGATGAAFLRATAADLEAMRGLEDAHPGFARLAGFEVRLPDAVHTGEEVAELIALLMGAFAQIGYHDVPVFLEIPFGPDEVALRPHALHAMRGYNDSTSGARVGLKLRTGGINADLFPSTDALAHALVDAYQAGVPFKATAGLHHPLRQYREEVETQMHGFLNVFGGAILLYTYGLDRDALTALLADEDADAFSLTHETLHYRDLSVTRAQIHAARETFAQSFGSCSFDEPLADLRAMGWFTA